MELNKLVASLTPKERTAMAAGIRNRPLKPGRFVWADGACALGTMALELGLFEPMPKGASDHNESGKEGTFSEAARLANERAYRALWVHFYEHNRNIAYRTACRWDDAIDNHGKDGILAALETA